MSTNEGLAGVVVESDPVAEYRALQRKFSTGVLFMLWLCLAGPFIALAKPWDARRRLTFLRIKINDALGTYFQKEATERSMAKRQGDCNRCGACCQLLYRCPYLKQDADGYKCGIYQRRPDQCATYPHNQKVIDLLVKAGGSCSYSFREEEPQAPRIADMIAG